MYLLFLFNKIIKIWNLSENWQIDGPIKSQSLGQFLFISYLSGKEILLSRSSIISRMTFYASSAFVFFFLFRD